MKKECTICKEVKPVTQYSKKSSAKDGYQSSCKSCKSDTDRAYREANKEKLLASKKAYYESNKAKIRSKQYDKYHTATEEEVLARQKYKKQYNATAPEEVKERKKEYDKNYFASEAGKITTAKSVHKRRAQKIASEDGTVTSQALEALKSMQNYQCKYCNCSLDFTAKGKVHLDHVVPLSKGGAHSITNVVWSCASCNLHKSDTIIEET